MFKFYNDTNIKNSKLWAIWLFDIITIIASKLYRMYESLYSDTRWDHKYGVNESYIWRWPSRRMIITAIYRNAGTTGLQVKFLLAAHLSEEVYISLPSRDSLLIDISNHCARIAVLHAKEARFAMNKRNGKKWNGQKPRNVLLRDGNMSERLWFRNHFYDVCKNSLDEQLQRGDGTCTGHKFRVQVAVQ